MGVYVGVHVDGGGTSGAAFSSPMPWHTTATPTPRPTEALGSASPTTLVRPTVRMGHVGVTIQMPLPFFVPDRDSNPDDGTTMYLVGNSGGFPVDVARGIDGTVWGGAAFPTGLRKSVFDQGLWASPWPGGYASRPSGFASRPSGYASRPSGYASCGPDSWGKATTYRIDPATGAVTLTLKNTYLVGAAFEGVYVASQGRVLTVDPTDGKASFGGAGQATSTAEGPTEACAISISIPARWL